MKLVIDRSKWLRGEGDMQSRLIRPSDGKMCCLGFYGLALGVSRDAMLDRSTPAQAMRKGGDQFPPWTEAVQGLDEVNVCARLMSENDTVELSAAERERRITELFALRGVEVVFVDGPEAS